MTDKKLNNTFRGPLAEEIVKYIDFKHQSGSQSTSSEMALKAFDRFCVAMENQNMSPLQLAEAWVKRCDDKPKHDHGYSVRQLGQYLTETHHPKAFTVLDAKGNAPKPLGVHTGPFAEEIKEFIEYKRMTGRKYIIAEYCLKAFNIFCAINTT